MKKAIFLVLSALFLFAAPGCSKEIKPKDEIPTITNYDKVGRKVKKLNLDFNDVTFKSELKEVLNKVMIANNFSEIEAALRTISAKTYSLANKYFVADALSSYDPENATYIERSNSLKDAYYDYVDFYNDLVVELSKNDQYIEEFFSDYTDSEIEFTVNLAKKKQDDNYIKINKELDEIREEANKIPISMTDTSNDDKLLDLMLDFINKNHELANILGFNSYTEYADLNYNRSYTETDVNDFINNTKTYLLPLMQESTNFIDYTGLINSLSRSEYNYLVELSDSSIYDKDYKTINLLDNYAKKIGGSYYNTYIDFFDNGYYVFANKTNSLEGAYTCDYLSYFGPNNQDAFTVAHEFGHFYSLQNYLLQTKSLDLKEFYSQANAYLFTSYLEHTSNKTLEKIYNARSKISVSDSCRTIVIASALREFENKIYSNTLTDKSEIKEIWNNINKDEYNGLLKDYWKVEIRYDMYYISYATSVTGALALYEKSTTDLNGAIDTYIKACNNSSIDDDIDKVLIKAGLTSPFDEETFKKIVKILEEKR